ncbi:MAG TPA: hypothetical protein VG368_08085 [Acidimicrobiales bacterium]|nr:hypothetical protein [Acidimicrobiales bacterium]
MATVQLSDAESLESVITYGAPHCESRGVARGSLFHPDGYSLWRVLGELDANAELEWGTEHGDEALFVLNGTLECGGERVLKGSGIIVEAGVATVVAFHELTELVHFGPIATTPPTAGLLGPAADEGRGVHLVSEADAPSIRFRGPNGGTATYFGDGSCPTCRINFFLIDGSAFGDGFSAPSHLHSEDEIIHVLDGELQVGRHTVLPGTSIAVPGSLRYSFRTAGPFRYLNYRADASTILSRPGSEPRLETVASMNSGQVEGPE